VTPRLARVAWVSDAEPSARWALDLSRAISRQSGAALAEVNLGGLIEGDPQAQADAIREELARACADLVVIGDLGPRRGEGSLGALTAAVLKEAACPVAVARGPVSRARPIRRILCPHEFSDPSALGLDWAATLARGAGAGLVLLHVLERFPDEPWGRGAACITEDHTDLGEAAVDRLRQVMRDAGGTAEVVVATGRPYRQILRVAHERQVDLIVLGAHGRRWLDRVMCGGTCYHVLRHAECAVLAVRQEPVSRAA
jgi:universal stress protein A